MANELRIEAHLEYSKAGVKESKHDSKYINVSGESYSKNIQVVQTSNEAISVITDIDTAGYVFIKNLDSTNYVEISDANDTNYFLKLKAGEFALFRAAQSSYFAKANTAAINLEIVIIED
tara:strand:- start:584 stop:943 length:360 start_codon:yes stop_codon:yes gene_type:complete